ncbi:hypothetical protein JAO29_20255 [Edaphobacter sp. HDX4]|uniref:hypothetical protein n=1 Tax=Edaphobacter sp. HDX4 TaxID=2794064 RepID=UPI002FE69497
MGPVLQPIHPRPDRNPVTLDAQHGCQGAMHQHLAEIAVAALGDAQQRGDTVITWNVAV